MKCFSPVQIEDTRGRNPLKSQKYIMVPCGHCLACLDKRRREWTARLKFEARNSTSAHFVTLTYDDLYLTYVNGTDIPTLVKSDFQKFMKRLRKNTGCKLRYYAAGEYGARTMRPHYHVCLFNLPEEMIDKIDQSWQLGMTLTGRLDAGGMSYVASYITKKSCQPMIPEDVNDSNYQAPFSCMSTKPAIGDCYLTPAVRSKYENSENTIIHVDGHVTGMPRCFQYVKDTL